MRNATLHGVLEAFTADAAGQLTAETATGAEIPYEVIDAGGRAPGRVPLYCYRPLTAAFIRERLGLLSALATYAPAARAIAGIEGAGGYLRARGEDRIPQQSRPRADAVLRSFLAAVFAERTQFGFEPARFEAAYDELERALYEGSSVMVVIAPLLGIALDHTTDELALGDGLSLVRGERLPDAPADAVWCAHGPDGGVGEDPSVLISLTITTGRSAPAPVALARARFRRILTALRLFERGGYSLGPIAWARTDTGVWRTVALGGSGRPRFLTVISSAQEDELRAFCNLIDRRAPTGELAWALARFQMGCERLAPFEALTDYLLALRALLEPEGPASGRLAQRLAVICAQADGRTALAERTAHAISLERAVIAGLAPAEPGVATLVDELAEHLRALLRDALCGHLGADLRAVADELLAESAQTEPDADAERDKPGGRTARWNR